MRETVFGAVAGAIGGAAAKPLAAAASWAGRAVGPAAQRFGAGALSAARQAASKVSQALVRTAQNIRTHVVQQTRSAVQKVSRLLPSQSGRAGNVARVWNSTDPHVGDVANAIERAMPGRIASINSQRAQSNGLTREVDIDLGSLIIQVKSQNARGLTGQILRTQATTGTRTAGYAPDISDAAWRNAAREGVPILRTHEELMGFIREFG